MLIRSFASFVSNKAEIENFNISGYKLTNSKIDKQRLKQRLNEVKFIYDRVGNEW